MSTTCTLTPPPDNTSMETVLSGSDMVPGETSVWELTQIEFLQSCGWQGGSAPKFLDTRRSRESSIRKGKCGWKLLYEEVLTGRVGPKNLGQILEKVQNGLKRLAKISKKSENLFKFPPCFARISPNIDLINLKPFPIDFYGQFASKWDPVSKIPFLLPPWWVVLLSHTNHF